MGALGLGGRDERGHALAVGGEGRDREQPPGAARGRIVRAQAPRQRQQRALRAAADLQRAPACARARARWAAAVLPAASR